MGMFDSYTHTCPHCGQQVEWQSKEGPRELRRFTKEDVPPAVAADLHGQREQCPGCGARFVFTTQITHTVTEA